MWERVEEGGPWRAIKGNIIIIIANSMRVQIEYCQQRKIATTFLISSAEKPSLFQSSYCATRMPRKGQGPPAPFHHSYSIQRVPRSPCKIPHAGKELFELLYNGDIFSIYASENYENKSHMTSQFHLHLSVTPS